MIGRLVRPLAAIGAAALSMGQAPAPRPATTAAPAVAADVEMWRLDCGQVDVRDLNAFSDTFAYTGRTKRLVASCYLIRHGRDYMLWDAGLPAELIGKPAGPGALAPGLTTTIAAQLRRIGVAPSAIGRIGISHYHFDHIGQAAGFAGATLLIGQGDLNALRSGAEGVDPKPLAHWVSGGGKVEPVAKDRDVFGDGSVTMLALPGHTPGHHGLLVRLAGKGPVLISGDVAHFRENLDGAGVPPFNTDRADSLASIDRFRKIGQATRATMILQHDPADVAKLPAFPASAR